MVAAQPRRAASVRRILQLLGLGLAVAAVGLGSLLYFVFIPRTRELRTDTEHLIQEIQSVTDHTERLDTAVTVARRQLSAGDLEGATATVARSRAETTTSLIEAARSAMISAPLEMQASLALVLEYESQVRDHLSETGALLDLGRVAAAAHSLDRADSVSVLMNRMLAAAQRAGLEDVGRRGRVVESLTRDAFRGFLLLGLVGFAVLVFLGRLVHQRLTVPLERLDTGLRAVSAGDLEVEVDVPRDDEMGRLGRLFNRMVHELRQRSLEQEAERQEMTRRIVDASLDAVITVTPDGRVIGWNPVAQRLFGWTADEARGEAIEELIFSDPAQAEAYLGLDDPESAPPRRRLEVMLKRRDGREFTAELSVVPVLEGGKVVGVAGFIRDITETLELQEQVRRSQRLDAVGRLAGGIAHDFNNLMSVILAQTQLVREELDDGGPRESLGEVERAAHRAADLTSQLLAFARKGMSAPRVADVNELVRETLEMVSPAIETSVRLTTDLNPAAGRVNVDRGYFAQVLLNLVMNARDAMAPKGGAVTVTTRPMIVEVDNAMAIPPGRYAVVTVADEGPGLAPEAKERLFEPFFSTKQKGTGLGLATCHGIVRQAGGAIQAHDREEGGAEFVVHLPQVS